jgi:hypothetical protein
VQGQKSFSSSLFEEFPFVTKDLHEEVDQRSDRKVLDVKSPSNHPEFTRRWRVLKRAGAWIVIRSPDECDTRIRSRGLGVAR